MKSTTVWMVRHGETAWNAEGRVQGQLDVPLSPVGHGQARAVARALRGRRFAAIYSSDLVRVRATAAPLAQHLGIQVVLDPRLRERHYGRFQGMTYTECKTNLPEDYARFKAKELDYGFGSGETLRGFAERSLACVAELAGRHAGAEILVFTHGGVLEVVYRHATARGLSTPRDFEIPNAALNVVEVGAGRWRVSAWAQVEHLAAALDDLPDAK